MSTSKYTHLTLSERRCIYYWRHYDDLSIREIGRRLRRSHSTISREIKRNSGCWCDQYYHNPAQSMAKKRLRDRTARPKLKSEETRKFIIEKLKTGWTPEIISGRLKLISELKNVSHEAIYQYIYKEDRELIQYLPRKHKKRRKKYRTRSTKSKIEQKTSIEDRPTDINDRLVIGHWESDSIVSPGQKPGCNVAVERLTRLTVISKVRSKSSRDTASALINRLAPFPSEFVQSITYDNGVENSLHKEINDHLNCDSYFCAPYHSWEKGTVEQTNGLIRRFISKKTDITQLSHEKIHNVEHLLNTRPRKCLGFKTPLEVYEEYFGKLKNAI